MSEADRPAEQRANAPRRRRARRPAGPGANGRDSAGQRTDRGGAKGSDGQRANQNDGQKPNPQKPSGTGGGLSVPGSGQGGQPAGTGDGQGRQGRRRRRGGRGRRGGSGQGRAPEAQKPQGGDSTHTVRSGDGTAGATARQTARHPRTPNRPRSGGAQAASTNTTRTSAPGKAAPKSGGKSGGKSAAKAAPRSGAKATSKPGAQGGKPGTRNARGGRGAARHPRGGQRLKTVLETSAGGLVVRGLDRAAAGGEPDLSRLDVALIGRLDRRGRMLWSMPKGHIEPGETVEETARREVLEETGVDGTVLAPLGTIDYWFVAEGRRIHKTVHHHLIRYDHGELCDEDPEITEVAWVPFDDLPRRLAYPDERRLVEAARSLLPQLARAEVAGDTPPPADAQVVDPSRRADGPEPVRRSAARGGGGGAGRRKAGTRGTGAAPREDTAEESGP